MSDTRHELEQLNLSVLIPPNSTNAQQASSGSECVTTSNSLQPFSSDNKCPSSGEKPQLVSLNSACKKMAKMKSHILPNSAAHFPATSPLVNTEID